MVALKSFAVYVLCGVHDHKRGRIFLAHDIADTGIEMFFGGAHNYFLRGIGIGAYAVYIGYADFQFVDHGFIINSYIQLWDELMTKTPALMENQEIIKETIDTARSLTSINITMQLLSWDVFWGSLLAIPTGLMVMKKARPENNTPAQS